MNRKEARQKILAILAEIPTQDLPRFKVKEDGCIWFANLSMGWLRSSNPERMTLGNIEQLLACEAASRELARRDALNAEATS